MSGPRQRLRALAAGSQCRLAPGCWDGFTATLVRDAGFDLAFLSGGGLSMGRFGLPDMGFHGLSQLVDAVMTIRDRIDLPLIVDADTGFGNALNAAQTIRMLERAGASAAQIEDQVAPKRCGHMAGKAVVPVVEAVGRLKAALDARVDSEFLIVARTDALAVDGLEPALDRGDRFLEAGADLLMIEGPRTVAELAAVRDRFAGRVPLVHNGVYGPPSPAAGAAALAQFGVRIALHPLVLLQRLAIAGREALARLKATGDVSTLAADLEPLSDLSDRLGAADLAARGRAYGA